MAQKKQSHSSYFLSMFLRETSTYKGRLGRPGLLVFPLIAKTMLMTFSFDGLLNTNLNGPGLNTNANEMPVLSPDSKTSKWTNWDGIAPNSTCTIHNMPFLNQQECQQVAREINTLVYPTVLE